MHPTANVYEQVNRKCPQAPRNTILQLSTPYTDPEPLNSERQKFQSLHIWNSHGEHADHGYSRQKSVAIPYKKTMHTLPVVGYAHVTTHKRADHVILFIYYFNPSSTIGYISSSSIACFSQNCIN